MSDAPPFASYQYEIYFRGLSGELPAQPIVPDLLAAAAYEAMDDDAREYVEGGAGVEQTVAENRAAFARWVILPRMLRDASVRQLSRTVLGTPMPAPVMVAPVGPQALAHPDADLATARAAASVGMPMVASTVSSYTLEEIAAAGSEVDPEAPRWFQFYCPSDRELAESFVGRAEAAGYRALALTVDAQLPAWRTRDLQRGYLPALRGIGIANYLADPVFRAGLPASAEEDPQAVIGHFATVFPNPSMSWADLDWLRSLTKLPILLKGVLTADDARRAREAGMDGIIVSNHGGRQLDGAIASLDALPAVVEAVGEQMAVLMDGGVRCGADVFKALSLGARAVLIGRPMMWGLALGGQEGVRAVLRSLLADLDLCLGLSGYTDVDELEPAALARTS
jgi:lactate 2-monooxygenase